jgi:hypothetical protein
VTVHTLEDCPDHRLATALEEFEKQFTYPLGPGRTFRISHGSDYPRFFRAMGEAASFVAEREGQVIGVLGAAIRSVRLPSGKTIPTLYLGDLKVQSSARGGRTLPLLAAKARQWARGRAGAAFGVVMDGTPVTPVRYTGRMGIPPFALLGGISILRCSSIDSDADRGRCREAETSEGEACFLRLTEGRFVCVGGIVETRSEMNPTWLIATGGRACGRLEDTRRAKRLIADDGAEMRAAHVSCFAFQDVPSGLEILQCARRLAARFGYPAVFTAVDSDVAAAMAKEIKDEGLVLAPASLYGSGFEAGGRWCVHSSEI